MKWRGAPKPKYSAQRPRPISAIDMDFEPEPISNFVRCEYCGGSVRPGETCESCGANDAT